MIASPGKVSITSRGSASAHVIGGALLANGRRIEARGSSPKALWRRVEEGRWAGTYWQPAVSLPRSSNWTCPFRTSSFPTGFTAAPTRAVHSTWCRATAPRIARFALRHSGIKRSSVLHGVVDLSSITALFPLSPAHQKQGSFPPPTLPGIYGRTTLSDFRTGHHPYR